jgi:hypothetical protein
MSRNTGRNIWTVKPEESDYDSEVEGEDMVTMKPYSRLASSIYNKGKEISDKGRETYDRVMGPLIGRYADMSDMTKRDELQTEIYDETHGAEGLDMSYDSIAKYLNEHPEIVDKIHLAFDKNLSAQGRARTEIDAGLNKLKENGEAFRVNYIYTLLTTPEPDYTISPGFSKRVLSSMIDNKEYAGGKKRLRKSRKSKKSRKSRNHKRTQKHRRTRKYRRSRK